MKKKQILRFFLHAMLAFLITAIPLSLMLTIGFLIQNSVLSSPGPWVLGTVGLFILIYSLVLAVVLVCATISLGFLAVTKKLNERNSCLAGGTVAAVAYLPVYGIERIEGILTSPPFYMLIINGVAGGWLFWRLWERAKRRTPP